ncbi:hypothetical protein SAMN04489812_0983 [Microlunatus soli]|uniref:Uncharacterized protein n=1 Tax=Microlunatus soli TaxID=630515 RepID=A0A1H1PPQ5_9ACTN|nr:hypothetical protein SAMN04489812_0983 [Microlunatus soli]
MPVASGALCVRTACARRRAYVSTSKEGDVAVLTQRVVSQRQVRAAQRGVAKAYRANVERSPTPRSACPGAARQEQSRQGATRDVLISSSPALQIRSQGERVTASRDPSKRVQRSEQACSPEQPNPASRRRSDHGPGSVPAAGAVRRSHCPTAPGRGQLRGGSSDRSAETVHRCQWRGVGMNLSGRWLSPPRRPPDPTDPLATRPPAVGDEASASTR